MKENLGVIIRGKRDATEGIIYHTKMCDYVVHETDNFIIVEGLIKSLKKEINFIPEGEKTFIVGIFKNEIEALQGIIEFEKTQWGK